MTAIRHGCTIADAGHQLFPNGERHLRPLAVLEELYPADLLEETLAHRGALRFFVAQPAIPTIRTRSCRWRERHRAFAQLTEAGIKRRWPKGAPGVGTGHHREGARADLRKLATNISF